MVELILIRHGVTAWNLEKRFQGQIDTPLTDLGHEQAERTADALSGEPVSCIYSSDLVRAQQTALPIADNLGLPLLAEPSLRERNFGAFEGKTHTEIQANHPVDFVRWQARDLNYQFGGTGETLAGFAKRVEYALNSIVKRSLSQTSGALKAIVVVTHGGVLNVVYSLAMQEPLDLVKDEANRPPIENASINRIAWSDGQLRMIRWGDVDHLQ